MDLHDILSRADLRALFEELFLGHNLHFHLIRDATDHMTRRYGEHGEVALTAEVLGISSPVTLEFDGERKLGSLQMLNLGDTGEAKTSMIENLLNAVGLGAIASGAAATRAGLTYSLDDRVDERRVLRWGLLPQNNRGLVVIDEAHKFTWHDWEGLTMFARAVRSRLTAALGEVTPPRCAKGSSQLPPTPRIGFFANAMANWDWGFTTCWERVPMSSNRATRRQH